jgi:hypothetical protein
MREAHLEESSVMPDEFVITRLEAEKKILWYLGPPSTSDGWRASAYEQLRAGRDF